MATALTDILLTCNDCNGDFAYTAAEQLFYAERGMGSPERCPGCRARRRAERHADAIRSSDGAGGAPLWNDGYGNYGGSAPPPARGKGSRPSVRMHSTTCSSCGKATEVPFIPRGGRPVYCRDCFNLRKGR